jgi:sterol desaturase/sphingolipid hydroxylase (fatty acid hydroxylase superfamily)
MFFVVALFREVHFYAVHRLIHWPPLYRRVHSLHHRNVNPSPWSGLSMHPVEHVLYFSSLALHWVVPTHPLHAMFHTIHLAASPIAGHAGFEQIDVGPAKVATNGYAHYLHHKLFEVNYADGVIPLDRWFGTFHDGSAEADKRLGDRKRARAGRFPDETTDRTSGARR